MLACRLGADLAGERRSQRIPIEQREEESNGADEEDEADHHPSSARVCG